LFFFFEEGKNMKINLILLTVMQLVYAESVVETHLAPYKEFLEWGTYEGFDSTQYTSKPQSRYATFKTAFERMETIDHPTIVELGTSRSFNHGGLIGCNSDDTRYWMPDNPSTWDWGAGFFTRMVATALRHKEVDIYTVDICYPHIYRCKVMTADFPNIQYHVADSVTFLKQCNFPRKIHLLYLDTGDMTPIEPTACLQLEEAKVIVARNLIADGGYILIDDVKNQTPKKFGEVSNLGKSKYSLPFLLENGFELLMDEYQVLLQKKKS
jgi:hypothetical protein